MRQLRHPSALLVAALVLVVSFAALTFRGSAQYALPSRAAAIHAVMENHRAVRWLARGERWTNVRVNPIDRTETRVTFFAGPRVVMEVALGRSGRVERFIDFNGMRQPYGAPLSHRPWLIALGCLAFLLATAVVPLRRVRNLDVLALLALVLPLVLLDERLVAASVLSSVGPLAWLAARCAWAGLGPRPDPAHPAPSRPLLSALTPGWEEGQRVRMLRLAVLVTALAVAMVTISAPWAVDVGQAVMEGGTLLVHGVLPYGHMPGDVFHGDTYPLLSYLAYAPLALLMPVRDNWDDANGALVAAAASAIAVAWMLTRALRARPARFAAPPDEAGEDRTAGLRAALAWLAYPPLVVTVSSGTSDVLLAALLVGALLLAYRPLASTALVIVAGWFKLVPFALLPIWLARLRGRALVAALALLAASAVATVALLVALGGTGAPGRMLQAMAYQLDRRTLNSLWTQLPAIAWLQPFTQAAVLALIAAATLRVRRDPALASDPVRLAGIAGAVLIGLQLCGYYWTYLYLAWAVPCIVLALLAGVRETAPAPVAARVRARAAVPEPALG
jgi:glycosyl transferase family 87